MYKRSIFYKSKPVRKEKNKQSHVSDRKTFCSYNIAGVDLLSPLPGTQWILLRLVGRTVTVMYSLTFIFTVSFVNTRKVRKELLC